MRSVLCLFLTLVLAITSCNSPEENRITIPMVNLAEVQPLAAQVSRLENALEYVGSPIPPSVSSQLNELLTSELDSMSGIGIQELLDPFCIAMVNINPESRVKVIQGPAEPVLRQEGWSTFLVKVHNEAQVTAKLEVESPNALPSLHISSGEPITLLENKIDPAELNNRFIDISIFRGRPLKTTLSGFDLEYIVLTVYTRESGQREVNLGFNVGQGTQDIGFRNTIDILFRIMPAVKVIFDIRDEQGRPTMGSLLITDGIDRLAQDSTDQPHPDYRYRMAKRMGGPVEELSEWITGMYVQPEFDPNLNNGNLRRLQGIYPLPGRRVASRDEYPDFFFQPQIYRSAGEHVYLSPGKYSILSGRGPEYFSKHQIIEITPRSDPMTVRIDLDRWINLEELGWSSGDHHIHAAGCSHYESPAEGVQPEHMWRQLLGEDLTIGSNLSWGPSWYYQKQFFTGEVHPLSDNENLLRYDVEVSGFPSSHAGHLVLLNLEEDDYPNTSSIEEWPSWTLPVLRWAKSQGGLTGYSHSGWGLKPVGGTFDLPNYEIPEMNGIGANEYIVAVTQNLVDFYSAGDTPSTWELNMWYHTLNSGFRVRLSGETDFPCISDERVGATRVYAKLNKNLTFENFISALKDGRSYVSDGYSHIIDFKINNLELGHEESQLDVTSRTHLRISARAAGFLSATRGSAEIELSNKPLNVYPYWHIERARMENSRNVEVELVVNGQVAASQILPADGNWNDITFDYEIKESSWLALRIFPSSHTNPIFVNVDNKPIRVQKSVDWCIKAVDQCWFEKSKNIRPEELEDAKEAYDLAKRYYKDLLNEGVN